MPATGRASTDGSSGPASNRRRGEAGSGRGRGLRFGDGPRGVDEADVAERLGEVAQELSADRVNLLREQTHIVDKCGRSFEDGARPVDLTGLGEGLRQPEGAEQEGAFLAAETVAGPEAVDQSTVVG